MFLAWEEEVVVFVWKNFCKGKVGLWKEEMFEDLQFLFGELYGLMLQEFGYGRGVNEVFVMQLVCVFMEANKLVDMIMDGVCRYQVEFLQVLNVL